MAINDTSPTITYSVGATATDEFEVPFEFFENGDLVVTVDDVELTLTTHYTVTGAGVSTGGTVTLETAVTNVDVTIERVLPIERTTDFPLSGRIDFTAMNLQFDKIIAICQQIMAAVTSLAADLVTATAQFTTLLSRLELLAGGTVPAGVWVDVTASPYNAQGDGSDDTAAIQSAIDSGAPVIYFPAGTYGISSTGLTGASNQIMIGAGVGATTLKLLSDTDGGYLILWTGKVKFAIRDMTLDWDNHDAASASCITWIDSTDMEASNVDIINGYRFGFGINGCTRGRIEKCRILRDTAEPTFVNSAVIFTGGQSTKFWITDCDLENWGLGLELVDNVICRGNIIDGFGYGAGISGGGASTAHTLNILGNIIKNGSTDLTDGGTLRSGGIETYASSTVVASNIVRDNGGDGIHQAGDGSATVGNVSVNNGTRSLVPGAVVPNEFANYALRKSADGSATHSTFVGNVSRNSLGSADWDLLGVGDPEQLTIAGNSLNGGATTPVDLGAGAHISYVGPHLWTATTRNPGNLVDGAGETTTTSFAGAALGDAIVVSFSLNQASVDLAGYVESGATVAYRFQNETTGAVDLAEGTVNVFVVKPPTAAVY